MSNTKTEISGAPDVKSSIGSPSTEKQEEMALKSSGAVTTKKGPQTNQQEK